MSRKVLVTTREEGLGKTPDEATRNLIYNLDKGGFRLCSEVVCFQSWGQYIVKGVGEKEVEV